MELNELNKDFKSTEIGMIPNDWNLKKLGEIFSFYSTANYSKAEMSLTGEIGCIHYGLIHAISDSNYSLTKGIKYYLKTAKTKYELVKDGDVIMVDASEDLVGINKSVEIFEVKDKKFIAGLHTYLMRDVNLLFANHFRGQILNSIAVKNQMLKLAVGMKVFGVSKSQLKEVLIPLPPIAEQTAIAAALSDMDALIALTEQLIQKKKDIKQGLMQQLLKPKEGQAGWKAKKLGDVGEIKMCKRIFNHETTLVGAIPFYKIGTFGKEADAYISEELYQSYRQKFSFPKKGSILISAAGTIGKTLVYDNKPAYFQDSNIVWINNDETWISNEFLYYILQIVKYNTEGGTIQRLYNSILRNTDFYCPTQYEQTRIAQILTDADHEITALEKQLKKLRHQKEGMMQVLLTGRIRFKIN